METGKAVTYQHEETALEVEVGTVCSRLFKVVEAVYFYLEQEKSLIFQWFSVVVVQGVQDVQGYILP